MPRFRLGRTLSDRAIATVGSVETRVAAIIARLDREVVPTLRELIRALQDDEYGDPALVVHDISGATTIDLSEGRHYQLTMVGNVTSIAVTNPPGVPRNYLIDFRQDATGSRILPVATASWESTSQFLEGVPPVIATNPLGDNFVSLYWDGTNYFWSCPSGPFTA